MRNILVAVVLVSLLLPGCVKLGAGSAQDKSPKVHVFSALPDSVEQGKPVILSWEVSDASSVTIEPGIGAVEQIGSKQVTVTAPIVYTLTATNRYGKTAKLASIAIGQSGGTGVEPPPVQGGAVIPPAAGGQIVVKPEVIFTATPTSIGPGGSAQLSWIVKYADSVSIDQGIGTVAAISNTTVRPTRTTVYTLSAQNSAGATRSPLTVTFSAQGALGIPSPQGDKSGLGVLQPENLSGGAPSTANWTGTWQCGQVKMYLTQSGNQVTGWYDYQGGKLQGQASGYSFTGTYSESPSQAGNIQLTMSADGKSFAGTYSAGALNSSWSCTRISSAQPPSAPLPQPTANWSGKWLCGEWGTLTIQQSGDVITGSYTYENGKLKGNVGGNMLFGTWSEEPSYTIPNDAGDVEFTMAPDGNSFTGRWRYGFTGEWKTWNGNRDISN